MLGFFADRAGFAVIQSLLPLDSAATYGRMYCVGILNTLACVLPAVPAALLLARGVCALRLSRVPTLRAAGAGYVNAFRNVPLLLWLLLLYKAFVTLLPDVPHTLQALGGAIMLNRRGLYLPGFEGLPVLGRFDVTGGIHLLPEYAALTLGLTLYTAAFMAENLRGAIQAVPLGLREAGAALGLTSRQVDRRIIRPPAMRIARPALLGQTFNLLKNSSLAAAIGYPDLMQIFAGTVLSRTGRAVEIMACTAAVYLTCSVLSAQISAALQRQSQR